MTNVDLDQLKEEDFCYLTTTGRVSGRSHTIEIWFALAGKTLYMLAGGREKSDWVKNVLKNPAVQVRIDKSTFNGQARIVGSGEEDVLARKLVLDKYTPRDSDDLTGWSRTSLPVAVELDI
jgi:deazaflavin-dependent oxidoreductase (nitroreductase family)